MTETYLPEYTESPLSSRSFRGTAIVTALLALVLIVAAIFRFTGQNWDDFSHLHPDERFLTLNLLPNIGGKLEFTPDDAHMPSQNVMVRLGETRLTEQIELEINHELILGAEQGTLSYDSAVWLVGEDRVRGYPTVSAVNEALGRREVDAIVADNRAGVFAATNLLFTLSSQDIQDAKCSYYHPQTSGAGGYFDTSCSPLNPHNAGQGFYTYGTLPLFLSHFASDFTSQQTQAGVPFFDFQSGHLVWRALSALFDLGTVVLVFILGTRLHNKWVGLVAAILYAAAPLAIQKSHFGTVNAITHFFVMLALYFAVRVQDRGSMGYYIAFGIAVAAAVAGRINTAPLAGMILIPALIRSTPFLDTKLPWHERQRILIRNMGGVLLAGLAAFVAFRIFNPYAFQGPGFFGITPNPRWFDNIASGSFGVSGYQDSPPNWQWMGRGSYLFPLKDMLFWGMGIAFGVAGWFGWVWAGIRLLWAQKDSMRHLILFAWVLGYFAFMGRLWVMTMRYYLPLYGALAILASWALLHLIRRARQPEGDTRLAQILLGLFALILGLVALASTDMMALIAGGVALVLLVFAILPILKRQRALVLTGFVIGFTVLWGLMFTNIYKHQLSRVQGSRWIFENVSGDFSMQLEGDDGEITLVNVAVPNTGYFNTSDPGTLLERASLYGEGAPLFTEFVAPQDGVITSVHAPHLGDPDDDPEEESLFISIATDTVGLPLATGTLTADLSRDTHVLGNEYDIPLNQPLQVTAGQTYFVKVESLPGSGNIIGSGAVVLTEGDWDDRLTTTPVCSQPEGVRLADDPPPGLARYTECQGLQSWHSLVNSYDMAMSFPVDNQLKLDSILTALEVGDYLTISSNRFYDTLTRNPLRWPMSTLYYETLFDGELGYDLVALFQESYEFGPLQVSDQHLPIYDSPAWLNEFEADEAFHVYDHPVVYIFQKRDDYSQEEVALILGGVPLAQSGEIIGGYEDDAFMGVVNWPSIAADQSPTGLQLTPEALETQLQGGTWAERFQRDSVINQNQIIGIIVWWLAIMVFGWVVFPLLFALFPALGDRGYSMAKIVGLLLISWLAWFASSMNLPLWSQAGVLVSMGLVALLSILVVRRMRESFVSYLRQYWKRLAWIEVLTLVLFLFFVGVRLTNPDLWHPAKGGEKPMDFAYFNAVLRSTVFPPLDPWYAGGFINYYYFGFVLVGSPVLLLGVVPSFAYNLIVPTLFALTGIGAFSVAFNIVSAWRERRFSFKPHDDIRPRRLGNPWVAGIAALLLTVMFGNLDTVRVIGNGLANLGGYEQPTGLQAFLIDEYTAANGVEPAADIRQQLVDQAQAGNVVDSVRYEVNNSITLVSSLVNGAGKAIGGSPLPIGSDRWYWGPSRVLAEIPYDDARDNAITEMPYFTFLYGDLHAHMINMPILLLIVLVVYSEYMVAGRDNRSAVIRFLALALGALAVGIVRATNTWDWPSFLLFGIISMSYIWWVRWGRIHRKSALDFLLYVGGFAVMSFAFVLPYTSWYAATYSSIGTWTGVKSPLWAYLDIHGFFIFLLVSLLIWDSVRWLRTKRVGDLRGKANRINISFMGILVFTLFILGIAAIAYQVILVVVPLVLWSMLLFFRDGQSRSMRFILMLAGFAMMMTLGVEFIVIDGDIGRQNTVFKFYIQAWLLLSIVGGAAFAWLYESSDGWSLKLRVIWYIPLSLMVIIAAIYPVMATRGRSIDRMYPDLSLTLDGMAYMEYATHYETNSLTQTGDTIQLNDDYHIIRWLQDNVEGSPVIIEGRRAGSEYQWNGRISIYTGLPSVLGWNFHQRQQRTFDPLPRMVDQRGANIVAFYNTPDIELAVDVLRLYDVSYIIVSSLERVQATPEGITKFDDMVEMDLLEVVHQKDGGTIYHVKQEALDRYKLELID